MKKINILSAGSAGLLAAAALALLAPSGHAQVNTYNEGDLLLGFEEPGVAYDYVVDLGSIANFITLSQTPGTTDITTAYSLGGIAADLSATFGSGWATNSATQGDNVQWGIIGASDKNVSATFGAYTLPADTLFETRAEFTPGSGSTAPTESSSSLQKTVDGKILNSLGAAFNNTSTTANSSVATVEPTSVSNNWSSFGPQSTVGSWANNIEQPTSGAFIGATNSQLDLYELLPTNSGGSGQGTELGSFTLDSSGDLSFTSAAVPEPSTYAAIGLGAAFLLFFRRSRKTLHA